MQASFVKERNGVNCTPMSYAAMTRENYNRDGFTILAVSDRVPASPWNYYQRIAVHLKYFLAALILFVVPCLCSAEPSLGEVKAEYKNKDLERRLGAIQKLEGKRDEETVDFLMTVVDNGWENWQVKIRAIQFLGDAQNPKAVDLLLKIFASRSLHYSCPAVKTYTAIALGNFRQDGRIQDALIRGIQNDEPQVREACVQSLGKIGDTGAVPHLLLLLNDHSIAIRLNTVRALERLADPQAVPYLKAVSEKDSDEIVRNIAKNALKTFHNK